MGADRAGKEGGGRERSGREEGRGWRAGKGGVGWGGWGGGRDLCGALFTSGSYPGRVRVMSRSRPSHIPVASESCPGLVRVMSWSRPSHVPVTSESCLGRVRDPGQAAGPSARALPRRRAFLSPFPPPPDRLTPIFPGLDFPGTGCHRVPQGATACATPTPPLAQGVARARGAPEGRDGCPKGRSSCRGLKF